mmetsp:Transcript_21935/g.51293  ORF Transcript_21935/g.51293 Transcript_21935/m.51293 type:complete len:88 (+) Transcript_21935:350-613(+)
MPSAVVANYAQSRMPIQVAGAAAALEQGAALNENSMARRWAAVHSALQPCLLVQASADVGKWTLQMNSMTQQHHLLPGEQTKKLQGL